jgi:hypothetical protein
VKVEARFVLRLIYDNLFVNSLSPSNLAAPSNGAGPIAAVFPFDPFISPHPPHFDRLLRCISPSPSPEFSSDVLEMRRILVLGRQNLQAQNRSSTVTIDLDVSFRETQTER